MPLLTEPSFDVIATKHLRETQIFYLLPIRRVGENVIFTRLLDL